MANAQNLSLIMTTLTTEILCSEAAIFSRIESQHAETSLYGVTDGKKIGTYLEQKFSSYLKQKYDFILGNSASGIDFPDLLIDIKVTSIKQPQSSCPFKSARQKIFGLGYSLLIFVYDKTDGVADLRYEFSFMEFLKPRLKLTFGYVQSLHS